MKNSTRKIQAKIICGPSLHAIITLTLVILIQLTNNVHAEEASPYSMPGKLVDVGTHKLHINCQGSGAPAVIIDSGLGGFSLEWKNIQSSLSSDTMICSYDRAGYGWSELGPLPRTSKQVSKELEILLRKANVPEPYILVGHSFGGYNMRYFTSSYPEKVAGLILVDASHPEQFDRLPKAEPEKIVRAKPKGSFTLRIARPIMHDNYPGDVKYLAYRMLMTPKSQYTRWNELDYFEISARELRAIDNIPDDIPVVVLSRGKRVWPETDLGDRLEATWDQLQTELSYLSNLSVQVVAKKSGHSVHLDQPELVCSVITETVNASRVMQAELLAKKGNNSNTDYIDSPVNAYFSLPLTDAYIAQARYGKTGLQKNLVQGLAINH